MSKQQDHIERERDDLGRFSLPEGKEPLATSIGIRLPVRYAAMLQALPPKIKTAWLRDVIIGAIERGELPDKPPT